MQQAIIQILDDIAKESMETFRETNAKDIYPTWISTAKDRIQALGDGWIDIKYKMPELGERVLCFEDGFQYVASASEGGFYKHTNSTYVVYPTFWMPLPNSPKQ